MSINTPNTEAPARGSLLRAAIWVAIGAIVVAALLCVAWVLVGDDNEIIARAFWTVALLAGFAAMTLVEVGQAPRRPQWVTIAAIGCWVIVLLLGAVKIWMPENTVRGWDWVGLRLFEFLFIVAIVQLTFLHQRVMWRALSRVPTLVNRVITYITSALVILLAGMLVFYLTFPREFEYGSMYWRIVVSIAILAAVGSALLPLVNALFAPRRAPEFVAASAPWPTYPDGRTPLPMLPDGRPDTAAYMAGAPAPTTNPATHGRPTAADYGQPTPGYAAQAPGGYAQSAPGGYAQPAPGGYAQPAPGGYAQPAPGGYAQPAPGGYGHPAPGGYAQPAPGGHAHSAAAAPWPQQTPSQPQPQAQRPQHQPTPPQPAHHQPAQPQPGAAVPPPPFVAPAAEPEANDGDTAVEGEARS